MSSQSPSPSSASGEPADQQKGAGPTRHPALERIDDALRGLRYGSVLAIVQDGVVVQIERTEKTRLTQTDRR